MTIKAGSLIFGVAGVILALIALYGRFTRADTITVMEQPHAAASFLLMANTFLLIGIFLAVIGRQSKT